MIFDKITNIDTYLGIHSNLDTAIREIKRGLYTAWDLGRHNIDGDNVFCNVVRINLTDEPNWERHERYLDIHINLDGTEIIRCADVVDVTDWTSFDEKNDFAVASFSTVGINCPMKRGSFLIAFPQDAHMPGIRNGADSGKKVIIKVHL